MSYKSTLPNSVTPEQVRTIIKNYSHDLEIPKELEGMVSSPFTLSNMNLYDNQIDILTELCNKILALPNPSDGANIVLELPTGYGKSVIGIGIYILLSSLGLIEDKTEINKIWIGQNRDKYIKKYDNMTIVCCSTKALQNQYQDSFRFLYAIKGKDNYLCVHPEYPETTVSKMSSKCRKGQPGRECRYMNKCPYHLVLDKSYENPCSIFNYSLYLYHLILDKFESVDLGIFDECHLLPGIISSSCKIDLDIAREMMMKVAVAAKLSSSVKSLSSSILLDVMQLDLIWDDIKRDLGNDENIIDSVIHTAFNGDLAKMEEFNQLIMGLKLSTRLRTQAQKIYEDRKWKNISMAVDMKECYKVFTSKCKFSVFMSSTIEHKYTNELLKANERPTITVSRPSSFPLRHRRLQVLDIRVNEALLKDLTQANSLVQLLDHIIDDRWSSKGPCKTIIMTNSFQQVNAFKQFVPKEHQDRYLFHTIGIHVSGLISKFKGHNGGLVLVSPSIAEGVDFRDDYCRLQIILKVPFSPLHSAEHQVYGDHWYRSEAINKLIQMTGRGIRGPEDYCDTIIVDNNVFNLLRKVSAPQWWTDALDPIGANGIIHYFDKSEYESYRTIRSGLQEPETVEQIKSDWETSR